MRAEKQTITYALEAFVIIPNFVNSFICIIYLFFLSPTIL